MIGRRDNFKRSIGELKRQLADAKAALESSRCVGKDQQRSSGVQPFPTSTKIHQTMESAELMCPGTRARYAGGLACVRGSQRTQGCGLAGSSPCTSRTRIRALRVANFAPGRIRTDASMPHNEGKRAKHCPKQASSPHRKMESINELHQNARNLALHNWYSKRFLRSMAKPCAYRPNLN